MRSHRSVVTVVVSLLALTILLMSCNDNKDRPRYPRNTEHLTPAFVKVRFPADVKLPEVIFSIDNKKMRIYNSTYLPYQSEYDSVYLELMVSTEATIRILNETTNQTTLYDFDDKKKIDLTGGRLRIAIEMKDRPTAVYDFRMLTYGYDPSRLTWKKQSTQLPFASTESRIVELSGRRYWLAVEESGVGHLYEIKGAEVMTFEEVVSAQLPANFDPQSVFLDHLGKAWGMTHDGDLYQSLDLISWVEVPLGGHKLSMLITDNEQNEALPARISAVTYDETNTYYSCQISEGTFDLGQCLHEEFPVRHAYVYSYKIGGTLHSNILGGTMKGGQAAPRSFFTSDGQKWGITPYSNREKGQELPMSGGLFFRDENIADLYVVGGIYPDGKASSTIKRSQDRGVTWSELSKEQAPGEEFAERYNASGFAVGSGSAMHFYILGGVIQGKPSREIWHGWLDTSQGIINGFEN